MDNINLYRLRDPALIHLKSFILSLALSLSLVPRDLAPTPV